jgi:hypothetical protein
LRNIIDRTQEQGIDFLGVGEKFRQQNWTATEWEKKLKTLKFAIHVDIQILSGIGMTGQ